MLTILWGLCGLLAQAGMNEDPIVIEVEAPMLREPNDNSFARAHPLRWASGRQACIRFHGPGRCTYGIDVPREGAWFVWLRYATAAPVELAAGFVPEEGGTPLAVHSLGASGALEGKHGWTWGRLFAGELAAGPHHFALEGASLRPDCLLLTQRDGHPDYLEPPAAPVYDGATLELLAQPLVEARPAWLDEALGYELPEWFDQTRLCMHTRLSPRWLLEDEFTGAAEAFGSLGATCYVRHLKTGGEGAWWPSAVGPKELWATRVDVARGIIERAHAAGCRLIAYYRHMEDAGMAERRPEWVAVDDRGEPYARRGGASMLCLNSPYLGFLEQRLLELVERGADGFYFDEVHMPRTGCWCGFCRAGFREATGLEHPGAIDDEDPLYRKLQDFTNLSIERAFLRLRRTLHAQNPEVVLLIGSNLAPDFLDRHLTGRLMRLADSVKTEFDKGASVRADILLRNHPSWREPPRDVRLALGWDYCRDAADGRPPHVWIHDLVDMQAAAFATVAVIAHGGVANLDHPEESLPDWDTFGEAVTLGRAFSRQVAGRRPLRWAALHVPERVRDRLGPDREAWWTGGFAALTGAYEALLRERLPVGLVTDNQLAEGALEGYRVLFLPAPEELDGAMRRAVAAFREGGGLVVEQDPSWSWHEREGFEPARSAFLEALGPARGEVPFRVLGGPEALHALAFTGSEPGSELVILMNEFGWVRRGAPGAPDVPPACTGLRVEQIPPGARLSEMGSDGFRELERGPDGAFELTPFPLCSFLLLER